MQLEEYWRGKKVAASSWQPSPNRGSAKCAANFHRSQTHELESWYIPMGHLKSTWPNSVLFPFGTWFTQFTWMLSPSSYTCSMPSVNLPPWRKPLAIKVN